MSPVAIEVVQTVAVAVAAYIVLTGLALFLKAESATWQKPGGADRP